ncbi:PREDICTED: prothymosin alpha-like [Chrysochloris asiatica]|uniref:Prothymosin alpha n=1 Tax=Chrysochloris asiatica TaxID=185453 RepID=A0A9B0T072_CHRAS|nr:PREDICTED: prothymosin alpha-like [Chrysochloris asiatica]
MAVDSSSEVTTKGLKEKEEVVEETEYGRDATANGNANEENGEQEADSEVNEEEEDGDGEEEDGDEDEEAEAATGKWAAEDTEDDNVDTKKQKTDKDHKMAKKEKLNLKKATVTSTLHFPSQNLNMVTFK